MKAAIYCRLSEEDRNKQCATDDSNSIQNQKAMLLQYAAEMGWALVRSVGEVLCFETDGTSFREGSSLVTFESAQPVGGIELYTRLCCPHFEGTSADGFHTLGRIAQ